MRDNLLLSATGEAVSKNGPLLTCLEIRLGSREQTAIVPVQDGARKRKAAESSGRFRRRHWHQFAPRRSSADQGFSRSGVASKIFRLPPVLQASRCPSGLKATP